MKIKKWLMLILSVIMIIACVFGVGCSCSSSSKPEEDLVTMSDLAGKKIGVVTGSIQAILMPNIVPDANYIELNTYADVVAAFNSKKLDAFSTDESIYKAMLWEGQKVGRIEKAIELSDYGMIFGKNRNIDLQNEINEYIAKIKDNGTHAALESKWFGDSEPTEFASYEDLSSFDKKITIAVSSSSKPFVYIKNDKFAGFEVEFMIGFCQEYGYRLEFRDTAFADILSGVKLGTYDMGMSGITITDERKESIDFSAVNHTEDLVIVVRRNNVQKKIEDYQDGVIGVTTGTYGAHIVKDFFPSATIKEFSSISDSIYALMQGKIDVFLNDESYYTCLKWEGQKVERIKESLATTEFGIAFRKGDNLEIQSQMNDFIAKIKDNGKYDELHQKWFGNKEPTDYTDPNSLTGTNGILKIIVCNEAKPFGYVKNNKLVGYDIDFAVEFAKEYGYKLQIDGVVFPSVLTGLQAPNSKYDFAIAGLSITDERKESVDFSVPYHQEDLIGVISGEGNPLDQFNRANLGVVTGSLYGGYSKEQFPNASIKEFNNFADVLVALKQGKVDGVMLDEPNFNSVARTEKSLVCYEVPKYSVEIGFGFQKNTDGYALQAQMNSFLAKLKTEGKIDELINKWYGKTEPKERIPLDELSSNTKELKVAIDTTRKPFVYMYEGKPVGFEIEVLYMFCKEYDYKVTIEDLSFAQGLAGLSGDNPRYNIVCGGLYMTEERKESVNFSNPYMVAKVVMAKCERSGFNNFMLSIKEGFKKTFIREHRWKLIVEGINTTLMITLYAVLGGTLLGFALYMLTRTKIKWLSKFAKGIGKVHSVIVSGTPILVIMMILFYIIFTSSNISGTFVAIIGFIFTFSSYVYNNLALTVSGVDNGQLEAAYALGYGRNRAFFRIIFPQAMRMFLPGYSTEIVNLLKATSIVGYIAVNDITKMGDIIRGNTYEPFFPLFTVAIIYFAISWIVIALFSLLIKKIDFTKNRSRKLIKGVKNDKN